MRRVTCALALCLALMSLTFSCSDNKSLPTASEPETFTAPAASAISEAPQKPHGFDP